MAPLLIAILQPLLRKLRRGHRKLSNQYGEMTAVVQESVSGIRLVKSFAGEAYEEARFREESSRFARGMVRVTRLSVLAQPVTETLGMFIAVAILWVGARMVLDNGTMRWRDADRVPPPRDAHATAAQTALAGADDCSTVAGGGGANLRGAG